MDPNLTKAQRRQLRELGELAYEREEVSPEAREVLNKYLAVLSEQKDK
jgi:hypothetical protein